MILKESFTKDWIHSHREREGLDKLTRRWWKK